MSLCWRASRSKRLLRTPMKSQKGALPGKLAGSEAGANAE
jgi:hypothetical protein